MFRRGGDLLHHEHVSVLDSRGCSHARHSMKHFRSWRTIQPILCTIIIFRLWQHGNHLVGRLVHEVQVPLGMPLEARCQRHPHPEHHWSQHITCCGQHHPFGKQAVPSSQIRRQLLNQTSVLLLCDAVNPIERDSPLNHNPTR